MTCCAKVGSAVVRCDSHLRCSSPLCCNVLCCDQVSDVKQRAADLMDTSQPAMHRVVTARAFRMFVLCITRESFYCYFFVIVF
jgi:hypothetical protein